MPKKTLTAGRAFVEITATLDWQKLQIAERYFRCVAAEWAAIRETWEAMVEALNAVIGECDGDAGNMFLQRRTYLACQAAVTKAGGTKRKCER